MMKIKIFGKLTDVFGTSQYECDFNGEYVSELKNYLEETFSELKNATYFIVINGTKAEENGQLPKEAEIALLPPYSGG